MKVSLYVKALLISFTCFGPGGFPSSYRQWCLRISSFSPDPCFQGIGYDAFVVVPAKLQDSPEFANGSYKEQHLHLIASFLFRCTSRAGTGPSYSLDSPAQEGPDSPIGP